MQRNGQSVLNGSYGPELNLRLLQIWRTQDSPQCHHEFSGHALLDIFGPRMCSSKEAVHEMGHIFCFII